MRTLTDRADNDIFLIYPLFHALGVRIDSGAQGIFGTFFLIFDSYIIITKESGRSSKVSFPPKKIGQGVSLNVSVVLRKIR